MFYSRHNSVRRIGDSGRTAVRKLFDSLADWESESDAYRQLSGRFCVPERIAAVPGTILYEYLPYPTLLDVLENQECNGFSEAPWTAICSFLESIHAETGLIPGDLNLRNFLFHPYDGRIFAVDFEHYRTDSFDSVPQKLAAFVLEYDPVHTSVKQKIAGTFARRWNLTADSIEAACSALRTRRKSRISSICKPGCSLILLAGGRSRRMGTDKASLSLCGIDLLRHQMDKALLLGIDDILVSGLRDVPEPARCIPDLLPDRGPLGGIHACMKHAKHDACLVLSVDTPLIPPSFLRRMIDSHLCGGAAVTIPVHNGRPEPLAGVYSASLTEDIGALIARSGAPVKALLKNVVCKEMISDIPEYAWINCNTPEDYRQVLELSGTLFPDPFP